MKTNNTATTTQVSPMVWNVQTADGHPCGTIDLDPAGYVAMPNPGLSLGAFVTLDAAAAALVERTQPMQGLSMSQMPTARN